MAKPASEILRKYKTDGVPSSGINEPNKDDLREWAIAQEEAVSGFQEDIESIEETVDNLDGRLETVEASAGGNLIASSTWDELSEITGTFEGQAAEVPASDAGTHTDPVVGGTVANAGRYAWSEDPAGWKWVSADALAGKADKTVTISTSGLASGGGSLSANRTITVSKASEAETVAGTEDGKATTPLGVKSATVASAQVTAGAEIARNRNWPIAPSFAWVAVAEEPLPISFTFSRSGTAYRVTRSRLLESVSSGAIRHYYDPTNGAYKGPLVEPSATNIFRRSQTLDHSDITKSALSVTADQTVAPDGTSTADLLVEDSSSSVHFIQESRSSQTVAQTWTFSIWLKAKERSRAQLRIVDGGATTNIVRANFHLSGEGTATFKLNEGNGTGIKARIKRYANGWYKCQVSGKPNTSGSTIRALLYLLEADANSASYAGDGSSGLYAWGAQLEAGPRATSYIPTTNASASRSADGLSVSLGSWFNNDHGALLVEFEEEYLLGVARTIAKLSDGTSDNLIELRLNASDKAESEIVTSSASQEVLTSTGAATAGRKHRLVVAWEEDNCAVCLDGGEVITGGSATLPALTTLTFGGSTSIYVSECFAFATRPTDDELRQLTAKQFDPEYGQALSNGLFFRPTTKAIRRTLDKNGFVYEDLSATQAEDEPIVPGVSWVWPLADETKIWVHADVVGPVGSGVLRIFSDEALTTEVWSSSLQAPEEQAGLTETYKHLSFEATGLTADTQYYGRLDLDGNVAAPESEALPSSGELFRIKTLPVAGVEKAYKFATYSCINLLSTSEPALAFAALAAETGLLFSVCTGDFHYGDPRVDDPRVQRTWMRYTLRNPQVQAHLRKGGALHLFSDHDFCVNDCERNTPIAGTTALAIFNNSQQVSDECSPHFPYVNAGSSFPGPDTVLTQTKVLGNTLHIFLDTMSQRAIDGEASPTILGDGTTPAGSWNQKQWLKDTLLQAGVDGRSVVFIHMQTCIQSNPAGVAAGIWSRVAPDECTEILDFIRDEAVPLVVWSVGDLHKVAATDGSSIDFSTDGGYRSPEFMFSAIHQNSGGQLIPSQWRGVTARIINDRNYGIWEVEEDGHFTVTAKGEPFDSETGEATMLESWSSDEVTPAVAFASATEEGPATTTVNVEINKTFFGPIGPLSLNDNSATASVDWSTDDDQSGTLYIRPNCWKYTIPVVAPASGSITITLSNPSEGLALGTQDSCVLTAT